MCVRESERTNLIFAISKKKERESEVMAIFELIDLHCTRTHILQAQIIKALSTVLFPFLPAVFSLLLSNEQTVRFVIVNSLSLSDLLLLLGTGLLLLRCMLLPAASSTKTTSFSLSMTFSAAAAAVLSSTTERVPVTHSSSSRQADFPHLICLN